MGYSVGLWIYGVFSNMRVYIWTRKNHLDASDVAVQGSLVEPLNTLMLSGSPFYEYKSNYEKHSKFLNYPSCTCRYKTRRLIVFITKSFPI